MNSVQPTRRAARHRRAPAILSNLAQALLLGVLICLAAAAARAAPQPDACIEGYVWREAYPDDHVCVTPATREQAAIDNRLAATRRQVQGGGYGPDTCQAGFVWREARPDDHVCVTPAVREQTARDNRLAHTRLSTPPAAKNGGPHDEPKAARPDADVEAAPPTPAMPTTSAKPYRFRLPEFPWPPPPYSTRLKLDRRLLVAGQPTPSNGSVAARMEQALAANGYTQVSYYAVPDGFAMATQIERIGRDATSAAEQRWSIQIAPVSLIPFNLDAYLKALLGKDGDSFRVIVFTFTPTPFTTGGQPVPPGEAMAWVERGATALPAALAAKPYGRDTVCTALVYEFRISSQGAALLRPSEFDGKQHLRAAGILSALERQP
jgi:hypothetical protein